jgi:hypothetical protein
VQCRGATSPVDTKDVAVEAYRSAPQLFCWCQCANQVDIDAVRTTLRHAVEEPEARVAGSIRTGWSLTGAGVSRVAANLGVPARAARPSANRAETAAEAAELSRLRSSRVFDAWQRGEAVPEDEAAGVFRIDVYTFVQERHVRIARVKDRVSGDPELTAFIDAMKAPALDLLDVSLDAQGRVGRRSPRRPNRRLQTS